MSAAGGWSLGLARMAQALGRDLQRAARAAGGPERLWCADRADLGRLLRCGDAEREAAHRVRVGFDPVDDRESLARAGIVHVGMDDDRYPAGLRALPDPPFGLFVRGAVEPVLAGLAGAPVVAIVGSRRATPPGASFAHDLARGLAERGAVVVSGLAHGIDAAAHAGALAGAGATVAVLGCGVDVAYPRRNRELARRLCTDGALVSEFWPGTPPAPWRFPARNRIVAGLSGAVAVVEAGRRSGALITADFALELGRPVLAVPGWPGAPESEGCNALLRAGAALLESEEDVVAEVPDARWRAPSPQASERLDDRSLGILERLSREPMDPDRLAEELEEDVAAICAALSVLEVDGLVVRGEGQRFWAAPLRGVSSA